MQKETSFKKIFKNFSNKKSKQKQRKKPTSTIGKIWYFIWYDDSVWSWFANIILAFVLIKFIVYPLLGGLLGTTLPVVAVVSESMDHGFVQGYLKHPITKECVPSQYKLCSNLYKTKPLEKENFETFWNNCGAWYEKREITKEEFETYSLRNGFSKGDIIILKGKEPEKIVKGDIIVFLAQKPYPIIHRVVGITIDDDGKYLFETKGDHNPTQINELTLNEKQISEEQIIGVAAGKIPYVGWVKIGLVELISGKTC